MSTLDLWKNIEKLSVDEFMCLLFGLEPGTVKFDYGDPKEWPKNADLIYRTLTDDIQAKKLHVTFDEICGDPFYNGAYDRFYAGTDNPWWADGGDLHTVGKLHKHQLVKWLAEKNISSDFFSTTQPLPVIVNTDNNAEPKVDEVNTAPHPLPESISTVAPTKVKKKYKPRGAITAAVAATFLEISQRQVQNWDKGIHRPVDYPGRDDELLFQMFATRYNQRRLLTEQARAINKAAPSDKVASRATNRNSAFDDNSKPIAHATKRAPDYDNYDDDYGDEVDGDDYE